MILLLLSKSGRLGPWIAKTRLIGILNCEPSKSCFRNCLALLLRRNNSKLVRMNDKLYTQIVRTNVTTEMVVMD